MYVSEIFCEQLQKKGLIVEIDVRDSDEHDALRKRIRFLATVVNDETRYKTKYILSDSRRAWEYLLAIRNWSSIIYFIS